jgi:feruloyl esterase
MAIREQDMRSGKQTQGSAAASKLHANNYKFRLRNSLAIGSVILACGAYFTGAVLSNGSEARPSDTVAVKDSCNVADISTLAPADTTIVAASRLQGPVPHCKIEGYVTTTNPGPNRVNFVLNLPDKSTWNQRFYFANQGGSGGSVPTAAQHPSGDPLTAGFAWAATDKGHSNVGDVGVSGDWEKDPAKALDNFHRGAHVVTVSAQMITKAYYGVGKMFRYAGGCSGGGAMGHFSIQYHPEDYDGVLLGGMGLGVPSDPAKRRQFEHASILNEEVREPGSWISRPKVLFTAKKVVEACDKSDGAVDGIIADSRTCHFNFKALQCKGADGAECLTAPQVKTFENLVKKTSLPISTIENWYFDTVPPAEWNDKIGFKAFDYTLVKGWTNTLLKEPDRDLRTHPLTQDEMWTIMQRRGADPEDPNASPFGKVGAWKKFADAGGKLIYFTGEGDGGVPAAPNEQYLRDTWKLMGRERTDQFAKLYVVPGWGHCGASAGLGPADADDRLFQALVDWVEKGRAPEAVVAGRGAPEKVNFSFWSVKDRLNAPPNRPRGPGEPFSRVGGLEPPVRDFLLCPFPQVALFDKTKGGTPGSVFDAKNWSCVSRTQQARALGLKKPIS